MKVKHCAKAKDGVVHPPHVWETEYGQRRCEGHRPMRHASEFKRIEGKS